MWGPGPRICCWLALFGLVASRGPRRRDACHCPGRHWRELQGLLREALRADGAERRVAWSKALDDAVAALPSNGSAGCPAGVLSANMALAVALGQSGKVEQAYQVCGARVRLLSSCARCLDASSWPFTAAEVLHNYRLLHTEAASCEWGVNPDACTLRLTSWRWSRNSGEQLLPSLTAGPSGSVDALEPWSSLSHAVDGYLTWVHVGILEEAMFWKSWLDLQREGDWLKPSVAEDWTYVNPCAFLEGHSAPRVLNAGSGPVVPATLTCQGRFVPLLSTDGLAGLYWRLYDNLGLMPPQLPVQCLFEQLTSCFSRDYFHLVHVRNALDHAFDVRTALKQLLAVTRPGGTLLLHHARDEGRHMGYNGMHWWSFDVDESFDHLHCVVKFRNEGWRLDVNEELAGLAHVDVYVQPRRELQVEKVLDRDTYVLVNITKF